MGTASQRPAGADDQLAATRGVGGVVSQHKSGWTAFRALGDLADRWIAGSAANVGRVGFLEPIQSVRRGIRGKKRPMRREDTRGKGGLSVEKRLLRPDPSSARTGGEGAAW